MIGKRFNIGIDRFCIYIFVDFSHAIEAYLATVHGKDDFLLPKDPKLRAIVDQRLHFDSFLFERFRQALVIYFSFIFDIIII